MTTRRKYPFPWRILHLLIAALVLTLIPVGLWMASRGAAGIFDTLTNSLYSLHKTIGFTVLSLMIVRVLVKVSMAAPAYPQSMSRATVVAARSLHHVLYLLLFITPLLGWAGVTAFPALGIAAGISLPALPLVPQDEELAARLFQIHGVFAVTLAILLLGHVAAALQHLLRRDGVFQRMWFSRQISDE